MGWDLPPGVSLHHIPGNRPEDVEDEAFWTEFEKQLTEHSVELDDNVFGTEWFVRAVEIARDMAFNAGYAQGKDDTSWASQYPEIDPDENNYKADEHA